MRTHQTFRTLGIGVALVGLLGTMCPGPESSYAPPAALVPRFAPAGSGPVVAIDQSHRNLYLLEVVPFYPGNFAAFGALLTADGYAVEVFDTPFPEECRSLIGLDAFYNNPATGCGAWGQRISEIDVLVMASPQDSIDLWESLALRIWVETHGGHLMLAADHPPHPVPIQGLASWLGINWQNANSEILGELSKAAGTLYDGAPNATHPITEPFLATDKVAALTASRFSVNPQVVQSVTNILPTGATDSVGSAIELGAGRIFAAADVGMYTSQSFWEMPATSTVSQSIETKREIRLAELQTADECSDTHLLLESCFDELNTPFDPGHALGVLCGSLTMIQCHLQWALLDENSESGFNPVFASPNYENQDFLRNVIHWLALGS